ncbi:hypothetical protein QR510_29130, partial [Escherichia coli]|uniref:hypothetical protein n=1 Tax=Escherichia coli TaxID=562 RepID=UPI0027396BA8
MRWLLFISRVVLLCNIASLIFIVMNLTMDVGKNDLICSKYQGFVGTIIILTLSGVILNFILNIIILTKIISSKTVNVPAWLRITNL